LTATTNGDPHHATAAFDESVLYWVCKARQNPPSSARLQPPLRSAKPTSLNTPLFCNNPDLKPLANGSRNIRLNVAR
jgi:hypothetical protein